MRYPQYLPLLLLLAQPNEGSGQLFDGGAGDGFVMHALYQSTLEGQSLLVLYSGGVGDGSSAELLPATTLGGQSLTVVFSGGTGDGYGSQLLPITTLTGQSLTVVFSGSGGDGHDVQFRSGLLLSDTLPIDSDKDGIPDFWELLYPTVLNPNNPGDGASDSDGDGFLNVEEYAANTRPDDPKSFFYARVVEKPGGGLAVVFSTSVDRFYRLQFSTDLSSYPTVTPFIPGTGLEMSEDLPPGNKSFGRVEVQVNP